MRFLFLLALAVIIYPYANAQSCTPAGNETSYGTSNTWIGYIYDNTNFTGYHGYVNEGNTGSADFDESFNGNAVNYPTNGCSVYTETFSARYKLTKNFTAGQYQFVVGADDGYRLSIDGGATWIINRWTDQSYNYTAYAITLSGTYNMVLEYYENTGGNRISFSVAALCVGTENQSVYGTGDVWIGYMYTGTNFNNYAGLVTEGIPGNIAFDESFGGDYTLYNTSACGITTEQFSARYRLRKTFANGSYVFTVGGDDGYRLSMDGGATWAINNWGDHGYGTSTYTATLNGTYNMVLEYYENGGGNRVSLALASSLLPVTLINFNGRASGKNISLNWKASREINTDYYLIEKSATGILFTGLASIYTDGGTNTDKTYGYTDLFPFSGINYYRLRMVDKDRKYSYSPILKISFEEKNTVTIFPTVADHSLVYLTASAPLKNGLVNVYDITGKKVQETRLPALVAPAQIISLPLPAGLSGSYIFVCLSGNGVQTKQIIVLR